MNETESRTKMEWVEDALGNVIAGLKAVWKWVSGLGTSTWAGMSPEARALTKGLAIGFALGAFTVWMLVL